MVKSTDMASGVLICVACLLFIQSSSLRSSIDEIALSAPSSPGAALSEVSVPSRRTTAASSVRGSASRRLAATPNRTAEAQQQDLLVFTKIPRCGSTAVGHILHELSRSRGFSVWDEPPYRVRRLLPETEQQALKAVKEISQVPKPAVVIKEKSYIDFSRHGHQKPIYVSMVRDPLEHVNSWFYWLRAPFAVVERALSFGKDNAVSHLPKAPFLKKNFETCYESKDPECNYAEGTSRIGHPTQAFCTYSSECARLGSQAALQEAKRVVEEQYAVVGLLEDWDVSLAVMERLVPRFFAGASDIYREKLARNRTLRNENFYKPKLRAALRQKMVKSFQAEIEFYDFVKQRLYNQYESLKD
ncbi:Heparan sulfate 2-O-sulfotransferase pipe [Amphibalanus amphitrite]|uniref:Heparan sulfate 2-O-sulfotransferase pipe n=1 Tax=Amphibalanus amphitrite TaxID=1232801 RepID=A0A6A4XGT5_AMPAM|nr:Heparan sulfate 2-O-sulfotransferase pipe [Amphibalanus amphitrite]